jgi:SAM-dependent methyltransferase
VKLDRSNGTEMGLLSATEYWDERAARFSDDCDKVDCSRRAQRMRFESFLLFNDLRGKRVLDVGCGAGDFFEHLQCRQINCEYVGVDLSNEMVRRSRQRFPGVRFEVVNILNWEPPRLFDYTVSFGVHNIKVENGSAILQRVSARQFDLCTVGAHISLLTDRYVGFSPHVQAWRAEQVLALALEITPYVVLHHNYLPNDFSVTMYRQPLIDSRDDLLLD